ncbi:MAG: ABC transporter ATP-binding protein [Sphaerochaetaceae bacterium]|nr:ABC transporter ATP-binding protein [Sphaerochaetaceae bacterium]
MTDKELLKIDNISVSYGNIKALRGVSMSVNEGEIVSLIGANGAGKSTLLKAIVGQVPLLEGSICYDSEMLFEVKDKHFHGIPTYNVVKKGIALVPEGRRVFADLTVEENLDMGAFMLKDDALVKKKKEEMFDFFPILGQRRKQKSRSLSGGEQQMRAVARALMTSPRLLLLDEPGLGLAPLIVQEIFSKIKHINEENKVTVFVVEQNARLALKSSNDGYVMENGVIVLHDEAKALLKNEKVRAAYLGE